MWKLFDTFIANENRFSVLDALLQSLDRLWVEAPENMRPRLRRIADRAMQSAPPDNRIFETLAETHLFHFLRTGDPECEAFIAGLINECDSQRASQALRASLHICRSSGWLTFGDGVKSDPQIDAYRTRSWSFFSRLLSAAQTKLQQHREAREQLKQGQRDEEAVKLVEEHINRAAGLVDAIAMQLYFACGAHDEQSNKQGKRLSAAQLRRFWQEAAPLFTALAAEPHPHTAHQVVQTLHRLLPCAPRDAFLLATQTILNSAKMASFQYESLAVGEVVKLIQRALADHRELFQSDTGQHSECLKALLEVLDLFVEAGWSEARQLTHRLEEIYR
jgi:hypothetical protein